MLPYLLLLISFTASLVLAIILTYVVRNLAVARGWVVGPATTRHLHTGKIPRLGGVAIYLSFVLVSCTVFGFNRLFPHPGSLPYGARALLFLLIPGTIVFLSGLYDDVADCRPTTKLVAQTLAGVVLYAGGFHVVSLPKILGHWHIDGISSLILTVAWTLLITNAFNLIDGLDGLAAGSALFATLTVFVISLANYNPVAALLSVMLAGATIGFLRFNFSPATIFLGDCGSLFVGFMLCGLSLAGRAQQKSSTIIAVAIPVIAFGLPLVETALSIVRRFMKGQPIFTADREHIHHKLLQLGWSQRQVVMLLYLVSALFALLSLLLLTPGAASIALVLIVVGVGVTFGVRSLGYHEFSEFTRIARRTIEQREVVINNVLIRRGTEQLRRTGSFAEVCRAIDETFHRNAFDAFELQVPLTPSNSTRSHLVHRWSRDEQFKRSDAGAIWSLVLNLSSAGGEHCGNLCLYRRSGTPLMLDINLLTDDFHSALSQACQRSSTPHELAMGASNQEA